MINIIASFNYKMIFYRGVYYTKTPDGSDIIHTLGKS